MIPLDFQVKLQLPAQFVRQNRSSRFRSRTSFFKGFLNTDLLITQEYYDLIQEILFQFFHNGLSYKDILQVQIFLRAVIKTEFMFTDFIAPVELMNYYNIAVEIEQKKQEDLESTKRESYK